MMDITRTISGNTAALALKGRLDTVTSNDLSKELDKLFAEGAYNLIFDLKEIEYISSAGLRILLSAQKKAKSLGAAMEVTGANENVKEVFDMTGFSNILTIK
jgi:anti-sigma B factor antagonist